MLNNCRSKYIEALSIFGALLFLTFLPLVSLGDPLNGGISAGLGDFFWVLFGLVIPSVTWVIIVVIQFYKKTENRTVYIYLLGVYLLFQSVKYFIEFWEYISRKSKVTYLDGSHPDLTDEKQLIALCIFGVIATSGIITYQLIAFLKAKK